MPAPSLRTSTEYQQQALARLPLQFRGRPRLLSMLTALAGQHQDAEANLFSLWVQRILGTATGAALTQLGAVVGQERGSLSDESLRLRINARLLINRSSGTVPELLAIFALITTLQAELLEYPPAAFELRLEGGELVLPEDFASILREARAAGVGASLLYQLEADADTFTFDAEGGGGAGFPITSYDSAVGPAVAVVNPGGALAPLLELYSPPELAASYFVTVTITFVDVAEVQFDYSILDGGAVASGAATFDDTVILVNPDALPLFSGLAITFPGGEPYAPGDVWTWEVQGPEAGGSLSGVLSA